MSVVVLDQAEHDLDEAEVPQAMGQAIESKLTGFAVEGEERLRATELLADDRDKVLQSVRGFSLLTLESTLARKLARIRAVLLILVAAAQPGQPSGAVTQLHGVLEALGTRLGGGAGDGREGTIVFLARWSVWRWGGQPVDRALAFGLVPKPARTHDQRGLSTA